MADNNDLIYSVGDTFCEGLARIDQLGSCRRLTFVIRDPSGMGRQVVANLILQADALPELVQMIVADIHVPKEVTQRSAHSLAN